MTAPLLYGTHAGNVVQLDHRGNPGAPLTLATAQATLARYRTRADAMKAEGKDDGARLAHRIAAELHAAILTVSMETAA